MKWGWLLGGLAVLGLGCGSSSDVAPAVDAAAAHAPAVASADARAPDVDAAVDATGSAADAAGADRTAAAATWSTIYSQLLTNPGYASNCTGSSCHDPGVEKGIDLSTVEKGYTTILHRLTPGKPSSSDLITVLQSGYMPEGRPQMPAADVARISAWIQAGALDD